MLCYKQYSDGMDKGTLHVALQRNFSRQPIPSKKKTTQRAKLWQTIAENLKLWSNLGLKKPFQRGLFRVTTPSCVKNTKGERALRTLLQGYHLR